ncbi:MAG: CpaF family protein [Oscillospiraceae bacterium]|nr:CpaF family protein [Oscillospiraceae bacterium]
MKKMSISTYEFLSILQARTRSAPQVESNSDDYVTLLENVRASIAQNHAEELGAALNDPSAIERLKTLILRYSTEYMAGAEYDRDGLVERIYQDMAGLGVLTPYLQDPTVEEININRYDFLEIIRPTGTEYLYEERAFAASESALDIVKRMVRMGGKILDAQTPHVDSFIGSSTRISAHIPPLVPVECGVTASIRKQSKSRITRERFVQTGSATDEMLDFLILCLCNRTSIGIAGSTGSGKSTLESFLINEYITWNEDYNNRVLTIEDTQELNLIRHDVEHDRPARVIPMFTQETPVPVTMFDLTKDALRYHPQLIVPAEVRDGAVYEAMSAGRTGHTILTSLHADSARDSYRRLVSLCHMAKNVNQSDSSLLTDCISAWPIIIFAKQLKDNTRKIMEIFEATGHCDGQVVGNSLYRFCVEDTIRDGRGNVTKVLGHHERTGCISQRLYTHLLDNGAMQQKLHRMFPELVKEEIA